MKIQAPGTVRANTPRRTAKSDGNPGSNFASHIRPKAARPGSPVSDAAQIGSVEALLAVQAGDGTSGNGSSADIRHAEDLLERLDSIRIGILTGRISRASLEDIVKRLEVRRRESADPRLAAVIDEIELRARVELAKLSVL